MNCALLSWAASQDKLKPHELGILIRLVGLMDDDGRLVMAQADLWRHMGIGERQTRAAVSALVSGGYLKRTRRGTIGKGRAPDLLSANFRPSVDKGEKPPLSHDNGEKPPPVPLSAKKQRSADMGDASPPPSAKSDSADNAVKLPVSAIQDAEFVDNGARHISTGARADKLTLNTTTPELYPERAESSFESVAREMRGGGVFQEDWTLSAKDRAFANSQGVLNGSVDVVFAMFGAHHLSKHTISANWSGEWRKWVLRQAHDPRFQTSKPRENNHDQQRLGAADEPRVRRESVSPTTAARNKRRAEREARNKPIDLGRVVAVGID